MSFWGCNRRKETDRTVVTIDGYKEVPQTEKALLEVRDQDQEACGRRAARQMIVYLGETGLVNLQDPGHDSPRSSTPQAATHQPISVGICASQSMMFYTGGVISTCCEGLNHGVLVAG